MTQNNNDKQRHDKLPKPEFYQNPQIVKILAFAGTNKQHRECFLLEWKNNIYYQDFNNDEREKLRRRFGNQRNDLIGKQIKLESEIYTNKPKTYTLVVSFLENDVIIEGQTGKN